MKRGKRRQQQQATYFEQRIEPMIKGVVSLAMMILLFVIVYQFSVSLKGLH